MTLLPYWDQRHLLHIKHKRSQIVSDKISSETKKLET